MKVTYGHSKAPQVKDAVQEISQALKGIEPRLVLFFASPAYGAAELAQGMQKAFPKSQTLGCTTSGELVTGKMLKQSLVAMAFGSDVVADVAVAMSDDLKAKEPLSGALSKLAGHYGKKAGELSPNEYVGIVLTDGLSGCEELVNERLGDATNITFIGGSAGDDLKFDKTFVMVGEVARTNASAMALIKPACKFSTIKTQSFKALDKELVPTKIRPGTREILEFNGQPAVRAYADALGVSVKDLPNHFERHPVGLLSNMGIFVRSPRVVMGEAIAFYCEVKEGMPLRLLEGTDIIGDTARALSEKEKEFGKIGAVINFHCILRTLDLEKRKLTEDYGRVFDKLPMVGLSTYGESFIGHINQTSAMLVFADR